MSKKQAGERKRTVTVVIGPKTLARWDVIEAAWVEKMGAPSGGLTTLAGCGLDIELQRREKMLGLNVAREAASHYD